MKSPMTLKSHEWFCKMTLQGIFFVSFSTTTLKKQNFTLCKVAKVRLTFRFGIIFYIPIIFRFVGYLKIIP